jgi:hypothetical protein
MKLGPKTKTTAFAAVELTRPVEVFASLLGKDAEVAGAWKEPYQNCGHVCG